MDVQDFLEDLRTKYREAQKHIGKWEWIDWEEDLLYEYRDYVGMVTYTLFEYVESHLDGFSNECVDVGWSWCNIDDHYYLAEIITEALEALEGLLEDNVFSKLSAVTWTTHLSHTNGHMLHDHGGVPMYVIDDIEQDGIESVFYGVPEDVD